MTVRCGADGLVRRGGRRGVGLALAVAVAAGLAACGDDTDDAANLDDFEVRTFVSDDGTLRCHEIESSQLDEPRVPCAALREPPTVLTVIQVDDDPSLNASVLSLPPDWTFESAQLGDEEDLEFRTFERGALVLGPPITPDDDPIVIILRFGGDRYSCIHVGVDLDCGFADS